MKTTTLNIRMDNDLKERFDAFCEDMGMSMSTCVNIFARKAVRENRIPFVVGAEVPNEETLEALNEVKRMKADKTIGKSYDDVDTMMKELLA